MITEPRRVGENFKKKELEYLFCSIWLNFTAFHIKLEVAAQFMEGYKFNLSMEENNTLTKNILLMVKQKITKL